jgi:hypothetical protein
MQLCQDRYNIILDSLQNIGFLRQMPVVPLFHLQTTKVPKTTFTHNISSAHFIAFQHWLITASGAPRPHASE